MNGIQEVRGSTPLGSTKLAAYPSDGCECRESFGGRPERILPAIARSTRPGPLSTSTHPYPSTFLHRWQEAAVQSSLGRRISRLDPLFIPINPIALTGDCCLQPKELMLNSGELLGESVMWEFADHVLLHSGGSTHCSQPTISPEVSRPALGVNSPMGRKIGPRKKYAARAKSASLAVY